jgi:hypothetical protein
LSATQLLDGVTLRLIALAGAGRVTYSNEVPVQAQALSIVEDRDYSQSSSGSSGPGGRLEMVYVRTPTPHLALTVSSLTEDQRFSVQATDDKGRKFYATAWDWDFLSDSFKRSESQFLQLIKTSGPCFLGLDVPGDARDLILTFCVHRVRTVEFVVKPPGQAQ